MIIVFGTISRLSVWALFGCAERGQLAGVRRGADKGAAGRTWRFPWRMINWPLWRPNDWARYATRVEDEMTYLTITVGVLVAAAVVFVIMRGGS